MAKQHKIIDKRGLEIPEHEPPVVKLKETYEIPDAPDYDKIGLEMKGERILVQDWPGAKKIGSIYTPQGQEIDINRGRVCAVGPDVKNLKVGEVIYKVHGLGQTLKGNDDKMYIFLPENSAIARDLTFKLPRK